MKSDLPECMLHADQGPQQSLDPLPEEYLLDHEEIPVIERCR